MPGLCRALRACQACLLARSRAGGRTGLTGAGGGPRDRHPSLQRFRSTQSSLSSTGGRGPCWPTRTHHEGGAPGGSVDPAAELCRGRWSRWSPVKPCAPRKAGWGAWGTVANEARTGAQLGPSCRLGTAKSRGHGGHGPCSTAIPCGSKQGGSWRAPHVPSLLPARCRTGDPVPGTFRKGRPGEEACTPR